MSRANPEPTAQASHSVRSTAAERRLRGARLNAAVEANTSVSDLELEQGALTGEDERLSMFTFQCPWCKEKYSSTYSHEVRMAAAYHVRRPNCHDRLGS